MATARKAVKGRYMHSCPASYLLVTCIRVFQFALQAVMFLVKKLLRLNYSAMIKHNI